MVHVENKVLQVDIHGGLCVNCRLFCSKTVVKLYDSDSDRFIFLRSLNCFFHLRVLNDFRAEESDPVLFSNLPPVFTVAIRVAILSQSLQDAKVRHTARAYFQQIAQDLFFIYNFLQVHSNPTILLRVINRGALIERTKALVVVGALTREWMVDEAFLEEFRGLVALGTELHLVLIF